MATSKPSVKPLYVYSQAFGKEWVTVGAYMRPNEGKPALFLYAPSYLERPDCVSIDPINLPVDKFGKPIAAFRYQGLHDVLRDACPDSWGQKVLVRYRGLSEQSISLDFLKATDNSDRWGALAVGASQKASPSEMRTPKIPSIEQVIAELRAMEKGSTVINPRLREQLAQTSSGGARPKATVKESDHSYWLLKPQSIMDLPQTARLEHFAQIWGGLSGMNFAQTRLLEIQNNAPAVLVKRFDRANGHRKMCLSAASVFQYEFPAHAKSETKANQDAITSYPRLASLMRIAGCPLEDRLELFRRMIFNALCGNDDDHERNHALVYEMEQQSWRLSPAYDVVPNRGGQTSHLGIGVSLIDKRITRENILCDFDQFGIKDQQQAKELIEETIDRVVNSFAQCKELLDKDTQQLITKQLSKSTALITGAESSSFPSKGHTDGDLGNMPEPKQ